LALINELLEVENWEEFQEKKEQVQDVIGPRLEAMKSA
jgi:hypothetical protein